MQKSWDTTPWMLSCGSCWWSLQASSQNPSGMWKRKWIKTVRRTDLKDFILTVEWLFRGISLSSACNIQLLKERFWGFTKMKAMFALFSSYALYLSLLLSCSKVTLACENSLAKHWLNWASCEVYLIMSRLPGVFPRRRFFIYGLVRRIGEASGL